MDAITLFHKSLGFFFLHSWLSNPLPKGSKQWGILERPSCALCTSRGLSTNRSCWGHQAGASGPCATW